MTQKEKIIRLLQANGTMTQGALAEAIYGDRNHGPNIYGALSGLVAKGVVLRSGSQPSYYSLAGAEAVIPPKMTKRMFELCLIRLPSCMIQQSSTM